MKASKKLIKSYKWGNNSLGWPLIYNDSLTIIEESMPPGASEKCHYHKKAWQFFYILKGSAIMTIENKQTVLNPYEGITILPGCRHYISNSTKANLHFLVISHPAVRNDRFICNS